MVPILVPKKFRGTGRIMRELGDRPITSVTTRDISTFLRSLDAEGLTARNVNKHRQVLATMFREIRSC